MIKLVLTRDKKTGDVQQAFTAAYPFLKLEFYRPSNNGSSLIRKPLPHSISLEAAGLSHCGEFDIREEMTVQEMEKSFKSLFGLNIQVSRKAGPIWLETTKTDKWTLQKQNEHGREISIPERKETADPETNSI